MSDKACQRMIRGTEARGTTYDEEERACCAIESSLDWKGWEVWCRRCTRARSCERGGSNVCSTSAGYFGGGAMN